MAKTKTTRQAIIFGDGGLIEENPLLDLYVLAQTNKVKPKVCLLATASGDSTNIIKYFYHLYEQYPCEPSHLSIFNLPEIDVKKFLLEQDVIVVPGGNTKILLAVWREYGIDKILNEAYNNGTIISGGSAGFCCWLTSSISDWSPGKLSVLKCTSILPFSGCPHYSLKSRQNAYQEAIMNGAIKAGYAAYDYAALHFVDGKYLRSISITEHAKTFKVSKFRNKFKQVELTTLDLNDNKNMKEFILNRPAFKQNNLKPQEPSTPALPEATNESIAL